MQTRAETPPSSLLGFVRAQPKFTHLALGAVLFLNSVWHHIILHESYIYIFIRIFACWMLASLRSIFWLCLTFFFRFFLGLYVYSPHLIAQVAILIPCSHCICVTKM